MDDKNRIAEIRVGTAFPGDIADAITYVLADQIGSSSVRLSTTGTVIDKEEYYPFGDSSLRTFTSKRYRYVGKEKDAESGLYYYGARYYAAWTCRFISVDPLAGEYVWQSSYVHADNNPINKVDHNGEGTGENGNNSDNIKGGDEKQKVKAYSNPEVKQFEGSISKLEEKLEATKNKYTEYNKKIGKINDKSSPEEIENSFSKSNKDEIGRIQGLIDKNKSLLKNAKATEAQWNKLDRVIENVVFDFNKQKGLSGKERLDPNLVKAVMFSESEMGASSEYKELLKYIPTNAPETSYQLNLGRVTDGAMYNKVVKEFNIQVNWKENYKANGNKNDVMLAAGALILKNEYAKQIGSNSNFKNNSPWYNAVVAFKGVSGEGSRKADLVWNLYNNGSHPYTASYKLFNR